MMHAIRKFICAQTQRFAHARDGLAALEFALVLPMMLMLLLTSVELINALQTRTRVENTAASLSDVISRDTEITDDEMDGLWSAIAPLMFPTNAEGVALRVTSISIEDDGDGTAIWSEQCTVQSTGACGGGGFPDIADGSSIAASVLPDELAEGSSLIRVEIQYDYEPIVGLFSLDDGSLERDGAVIPLSYTSYRRSRLVDPIPFEP